jgi:hypothetical protein
MRGAHIFRCAIALVALAPASVSKVSAMQCCWNDFPLTAELVSGIQRQFAAVPAPGIAAAVPDTICSKTHVFAETAELLSLIAASCLTGVKCKNGNHFIFTLLKGGQVLAPKGLGRLLAEECPDSISDPSIRDTLVKQHEDELQRLGAWLHKGLEQ